MPMTPSPYLGESLSITAAVVWAAGVVLFKKSGETMSPMKLNLFKNTVAMVLIVPTIPLMGEPFLPDVSVWDWALLAASGVIGIAIADTLFFISLNKLGAGLTAVVDTTYTPIVLAMSFVFLDERMSAMAMAGALCIVTALILGSASRPEPGRTRRDMLVGFAVGIVNMILVALGIIMIKHILVRTPVIWATTVRLAAGLIGLCVMILLRGQGRACFAVLRPSASWRVAMPAALCGTYLAMIFWVAGMKFAPVSIAALLNQLSTIFIFVFAAVFLKEGVTFRRIAAILLAATGAALVLMG